MTPARRTPRWTVLLAWAAFAGASVGWAKAVRAQMVPLPAAASGATTSPASDMRWRVDQCMGGLTYGAPFKWALSYGGGMVYEGDRLDVCALAVAKVGLGGAGASVGLAKALGSFGAGTAVTGGIIRTFGEPLNATARRTYVGGAVHLWPLLALGGEVGYYVRLGDEPGASVHGKRIITWSTGFGF